MTKHYTNCYNEMHRLASLNVKRGRKYGRNFTAILDAKDPSIIHLVEKYYVNGVKAIHRPHVPAVTMTPNGMLMHIYTETTTFPIPPAFAALYLTGICATRHSPGRADCTVNAMLETLNPRLYYQTNGVRGKPGFKWFMGRIPAGEFYGSVYYNDRTEKLEATQASPIRNVDKEKQKHITTTLSAVFKRLKPILKMGVEITNKEVYLRVKEIDKSLYCIDEFMRRAETFDPTSHEETLQLMALSWRTLTQLNSWPNRQYNQALNRYETHEDACFRMSALTTDASRVYMRRLLHQHFKVVTYDLPGPVLDSVTT